MLLARRAPLYVNDTVQALIRVFDVSADGSLPNGARVRQRPSRRMQPGLPDGMKCDARQRLGDRAGRRVGVCARGRLIGKVAVPELVANLPGAARTCGRSISAPPLGLRGHDQGRPAPRALHARAPARRRLDAASAPASGADAASDLGSIPRAARSSSRTCRTTW